MCYTLYMLTNRDDINALRREDGNFRSHALVGGYPLFYIVGRDEMVHCAICASQPDMYVDEGDATTDEPLACWKIEAVDTHMEGAPLTCDDCGILIESAYGESDATREAEAADHAADCDVDGWRG